MPIIKQDKWNDCVNRNKDSYGKACVDVAREVMRIIDKKNPKVLDTHKLICSADDNIRAGGITGFMAGCVAQMVSGYHSRGEEFKKAWNKSYNVEETEAKSGVVNPAILTIKEK